MAYLTEADKYFLPVALRQNSGLSLATEWYFGITPQPWQYAWHQIIVPNMYAVCGIASGKTTVESLSIAIDCMTTPYFRALTTSVTETQAKLMYDMFMNWYESSNRVRHLVADIQKHPFKKVIWKNGSEWDFRTSGRNADNIRGSEYDRIGFDEAGLDLSGYIVKVLRGRLRGSRPSGVEGVKPIPRMARLDIITSPTEAPWLQENFNRGYIDSDINQNLITREENLRLYRSFRIATWDNIYLTPLQVEAMKAEYPPDLIDVEMGGEFPDYGMSMFPVGYVAQCTGVELYDIVLAETQKPRPAPGYNLAEDPRHGITLFEMPVEPGKIYIAAGDPGTGSFPSRNAGCVMVADVTHKPYRLVYFQWITGKGSYNPFLQSYRYVVDKYDPVHAGIDATGTQKALDELAFEANGINTEKINFTSDKNGLLNSLVADITNVRWKFPPIKGLTRQLTTYTLDGDKDGEPQDTVMTIAQLSYLARFTTHMGTGTLPKHGGRINARRSTKRRTTVGARR